MKFKVINIEELIELAKRSEDLQKSYDRLKSNYDKVYNENVQIKHKLGWQHDYEKENEELKKTTRELLERNHELYLEDIRIKKEKMTEGNQNVLLKVENEKLRKELISTKQQLEIYQGRCNNYHFQLQDAQNKIRTLKEVLGLFKKEH